MIRPEDVTLMMLASSCTISDEGSKKYINDPSSPYQNKGTL